MTPAMRDALLDVRRPESEEERMAREKIARTRAALAAGGVLGTVAEVAIEHQVELDAVLSCSRAREVVHARRAAWARIRAVWRWSYERVARVFETTTHTVGDGVRRFEAWEREETTRIERVAAACLDEGSSDKGAAAA